MTAMTLVKFTLCAAFDEAISPEQLGNELADYLRGGGALTVACEYDTAETPIDYEETDELVDALDREFPAAALTLGPVPGVTVSGRNGSFKKAHLKLNGARIELWLGTEKERYPLITFPVEN